MGMGAVSSTRGESSGESLCMRPSRLRWLVKVQNGLLRPLSICPQSRLNECYFQTNNHKQLSVFSDLHEEITMTWKWPYSACFFIPQCNMFTNIIGARDRRYGAMLGISPRPLLPLLRHCPTGHVKSPWHWWAKLYDGKAGQGHVSLRPLLRCCWFGHRKISRGSLAGAVPQQSQSSRHSQPNSSYCKSRVLLPLEVMGVRTTRSAKDKTSSAGT